MAFKTKLTTKGFSEYLERISSAGKDIDLVADQALQAGAEVLLDGMRRRVPVDTGNLKDSLKIKGPFREGNYHYADVGLVDVDADTARYGNAVEYGTSSAGKQSYVRATEDEDAKKARAAMVAVFKEVLGE